jgi:hypothetical protein
MDELGIWDRALNTTEVQTLYNNTYGGGNISMGAANLFQNISGNHNIALGRSALYTNTTGCGNIAIGRRALTFNNIGDYNIAMGRGAMYCNDRGTNNVAIGRSALYENVNGNASVAIGVRSLAYANTGGLGGSPNTAVGTSSLFCTTSGRYNTVVGYFAGYYNNTGNNNVAVGHQALYTNIGGYNNVAIGFQTLLNNTNGYSNTGVGYGALQNNIGSYYLTALGFKAGCNFTNSGQIAVGSYAQTSNVAYHTVWGNAGNSVLNCVWVAWTNVSDCRDKICVEPIPTNLGLPFIKKLNPVSFNWDQRQKYVDKCGYEYGQKDGTLSGSTKEYGIIAQEVEEVMNELNVSFDALKHNEEQDAYRFTYEGLFAPIIKSIQELSNKLDNIEDRLDSL